jgi:hypothetical protein
VSPKCLDRGRGLGPQFLVHIAPTCQRDCQEPRAKRLMPMCRRGDEDRITIQLRAFVYKEQADALAAALRRPPSHRLLRGGGPDVHGLAMSPPPKAQVRGLKWDPRVGNEAQLSAT